MDLEVIGDIETSPEVSLERRKIYAALADADVARHRQVRIVDESGEE